MKEEVVCYLVRRGHAAQPSWPESSSLSQYELAAPRHKPGWVRLAAQSIRRTYLVNIVPHGRYCIFPIVKSRGRKTYRVEAEAEAEATAKAGSTEYRTILQFDW